MKCLGRIERLLLILGFVLIAIYVAAYVHRTILSRAELKRFRDLQAEQPVETADHFPPVTQFKLDVSLWSQKRIAGHRDGFFRVLKDVTPGDTIELATPKRVVTYVVDQIVLVRPDDVSVLQPRSRPSLTLVTCYPFYFVGSAPQRYIVQASVERSELPIRQASKQASSEPGDSLQPRAR